MFDNTAHNIKATADNPSSAVAHLLTNRKDNVVISYWEKNEVKKLAISDW